ncbi:MAG: RDD family protein [Myxococcales bacterium]|nr:RDD family protein [Myxococcales bacterium]
METLSRCETCGTPQTPNMDECPVCGARFAPGRRAPASTPSPLASPARPIARRTEGGGYVCPLCEAEWETPYCPACATTLLAPEANVEASTPAAGAPESEDIPPADAEPTPVAEPPDRTAAAVDYARRAWSMGDEGPGAHIFYDPTAAQGLDRPVERASRARLAGIGHRAIALGLDFALLGALRLAWWSRDAGLEYRAGPWGRGWWVDGSLDAMARTPVLELPLLYTLVTVVLVAWRGQSPGKFLAGIRVVNAQGRPPGFVRAALRELIGKPLSALFFGLGYVWAIFDSQRQAFHDKIAGTWVVRGHPKRGERAAERPR